MIDIPWNIVEGTEILNWYLKSKYQFSHLVTSCLQMLIAFNLHWPLCVVQVVSTVSNTMNPAVMVWQGTIIVIPLLVVSVSCSH